MMDEKLGFVCRSILHVFIDPNPDIDVEKERDYEEGEVNVSGLFKNVLGKK